MINKREIYKGIQLRSIVLVSRIRTRKYYLFFWSRKQYEDCIARATTQKSQWLFAQVCRKKHLFSSAISPWDDYGLHISVPEPENPSCLISKNDMHTFRVDNNGAMIWMREFRLTGIKHLWGFNKTCKLYIILYQPYRFNYMFKYMKILSKRRIQPSVIKKYVSESVWDLQGVFLENTRSTSSLNKVGCVNRFIVLKLAHNWWLRIMFYCRICLL